MRCGLLPKKVSANAWPSRIATGVSWIHRGAVIGIDLDLPFLADLDANRFEAEVRGIRLASDGDQQLVRLDVVATLHRDLERAAIGPLDAVGSDIEAEIDAFAQRDLDQPIDDLRVVVAQNHIGAVDQSHVASELVENAGEFGGNVAAAGNHDPLRQLVEMEHFV
jgi:hypothetical protein